jgi:hypothetical protein
MWRRDAAVQPVMQVFNNLVLYDQHIAQNSFETEAGPVMVENFCSWFAMKVIPLVTG